MDETLQKFLKLSYQKSTTIKSKIDTIFQKCKNKISLLSILMININYSVYMQKLSFTINYGNVTIYSHKGKFCSYIELKLISHRFRYSYAESSLHLRIY